MVQNDQWDTLQLVSHTEAILKQSFVYECIFISFVFCWGCAGFNSPNMRSIMGFLPDVKEGAKGCPGLKATDFGTIPIAAQVFL